jgi:seryl-tRNA synthetase
MTMLDIRWIREHAEELQTVADRKGMKVSVAELLTVDAERRRLLQRVEEARSQRNALARRIAELKRSGRIGREGEASVALEPELDTDAALAETAEALQKEAGEIAAQGASAEAALRREDEAYERLMLLMPNPYSPDTPIGDSDADNVELNRVGEPTAFGFAARDHLELGEALGLFDVPRGVKVAGTRSYFLTGRGVYLHRAVQQLALDYLTDRGFTVIEAPVLAREEALVNTGFFPLGREQTYRLPKDAKWLVGTAEVPLVSYYAGEIVDVSRPIRLAGVSACFRREAGSAGRDVRGLYRVHQFAKVEQVVLCRADLSEAEEMLETITGYAEELLQLLELPYRVVRVCTGDMGQKNYKQYDIETWMPSRGAYGETHSSSLLLDFQSRRSNIRYRDEDGKLRYCYTLNNTAVASPRILIPLLENHQREEGGVYVPPALRPYMRGAESLNANA